MKFQSSHRNRLSDAHLQARCPHQGLDLTAVRGLNRLQWTNVHLQWPLARWRSVLFTDESCFLYRADGTQRVWRCVVEWFADVNFVNRVPHGGGVIMVWVGRSYGQGTQLHFIKAI